MVRTRVLGWAAGLPDPFWKSVTFSRGHWRGGGWPLFWVPIPLPASRSPLGFCCPEGRGSGETPTVEMGGPGLGLGQGFWAKRGWGSGGLRERDRIDPSGPPWGCPAPSPPLATPQSSLGAPGAGRGRYPREDPLPRGGGRGMPQTKRGKSQAWLYPAFLRFCRTRVLGPDFSLYSPSLPPTPQPHPRSFQKGQVGRPPRPRQVAAVPASATRGQRRRRKPPAVLPATCAVT